MDKRDAEVQLSAEYLRRLEAKLDMSVQELAAQGAFAGYNRGGGPAGKYDRHYDKSVGVKTDLSGT
jgi:hypothetical protein